jgi:flagellar biosynthesis protein
VSAAPRSREETDGEGAPTARTAVALRYRHGADAAPAVTAAGRGEVADRIIDAAVQAGVPVREDADLAQALSHLKIDDLVPPELYRVIAELLAWAYRMNHGYLLDPGD